MERIWNLAKKTETLDIAKNERMCELLIKRLENLCDIQFDLHLPNGYKITYLNVLTTILLVPEYNEYRKVLINILNDIQFNEPALLLHLLGVVNQIKIGFPKLEASKVREKLISSFSTLPYHQGIIWDDKKIELSVNSSKIEVIKYDEIVNDPEIYGILNTIPLGNKCHVVVEELRKYFLDSYIITSELPLMFEGIMYHSYFKTSEGVLDLSNNMFYPNDSFDKLINPKEILKVRSSEFEEFYNKTLNDDNITPDDMAPVLTLALNNKLKNLK